MPASHSSTRHGRRLQEIDHVLGQPRNAPGHQLPDGFGRAEVRRDGRVALLLLLGLPVADLAEQLVEEERVAVGQSAELRDEFRRGVGPALHQLVDRRTAQSLQVHGGDRVHRPEVRQHGA